MARDPGAEHPLGHLPVRRDLQRLRGVIIGERVVDVFYVKDVFGLKIAQRSKMQRVQKHLAEVLTAA